MKDCDWKRHFAWNFTSYHLKVSRVNDAFDAMDSGKVIITSWYPVKQMYCIISLFSPMT